MEKIHKLSRICGLIIITWMIALPIYEVAAWVFYDDFSLFVGKKQLMDTHALTGQIDLKVQLIAILVSMIPVGVMVLMLNWLRQLFVFYQKGEVFTQCTTNCIKKVAQYFFIWVVVNIFYGSAMSLVLSMDNPVGQRHITVGVGTRELSLVVIGLIVLLVSYVMDEARKLQDEQQYTV